MTEQTQESPEANKLTPEELKANLAKAVKSAPWYSCESLRSCSIDFSEYEPDAEVTFRSAKGRDLRRIREFFTEGVKDDTPEAWCELFRAYGAKGSSLGTLAEFDFPEAGPKDSEAWSRWWDGADSILIHRMQTGLQLFRADAKSDERDTGESPNGSKPLSMV